MCFLKLREIQDILSLKIETWLSQRRNLAVQIRVILTPKRRKDTTEYSDSDTAIHHGTIICLHENSGSSSYVGSEDDFNELKKVTNVEPCFRNSELNYDGS